MRRWLEMPDDQEDRANEALMALECLHDMLSNCDRLATVQPEPLTYMVKIISYAVHRAIPSGAPRHRAACNED